MTIHTPEPQPAYLEFERVGKILEGQSEILRMISRGEALEDIFTSIIHWVEKHGNGDLLASILIMDKAGETLLHAAAPSLPTEYNAAIHGIHIGPGVGSCGTAAYSARPVIVEDIALDPLWKDFKDLALSFGLRACWSTPLISREGKVLGTFAIYYKHPNKPTNRDLELIELVSRTAIIALEYHYVESEREALLDKKRQSVEQERQKFYQLLMDSPAMIAVLRGPTHIFELTNEMYNVAVGKGRPLLGLSVADALPEVVKPGFIDLLDEVYKTGVPFYGNEVMLKLARKENGELEDRYMNFLYQPIKDESGVPEGIFVHAVDVTEQVIARKQIEEKEQQIRAIVENAPFPIGVYVGKEMKITLANQTIIDIWGKGQDVVGKLYSEILPELANQSIFQQLDNVYTTGIPFHARNQRVDIVVEGQLQPYYFNYSFTPLYDTSGNIYGVMNTGAEITDLVIAQQSLAEMRENLQNAIEVAELGTWTMRLEDQTITYSKRIKEWFGLPEEDARLEDLLATVHEEDRSSVSDAIDEAIKTRSVYEVEYRVINKITGEERIMHARGQLCYSHNGEPTAINGTARDITVQKIAEQELERIVELRTSELKKANIDLHNVNENLQQFAYVASHDLQEPLRKIKVYVDALLSKEKEHLSSLGQSYLMKVSKASKRMSDLIRDLLEFSRMKTEKTAYSEVDVNEIFKELVNDFEILIKQKGAKVAIDPLCTLHAVPLQMNQLFYNLFGNALKFTREGVQPEITVSSRDLPLDETLQHDDLNSKWQYCEIVVADNGIGFGKEYRDQIFEIFQRLHTKDQFDGTGIGLALCKKIVQNHGGKITANSMEGQGSSFHVILPLRRSVGID